MDVDAPAKINLTLEVLDRRNDGYHGIRSVMVPLELADRLRIEPAGHFTFACDVPELHDDGNLVVRAVRAVLADARLSVSLVKAIPTQAGLGGGSSDAASTLLALMEGIAPDDAAHDWIRIARSLGSDVPFFLARAGALVEGTGERVTPLGALPRWHVLIVKPPAAVSTARAYEEIDRHVRPARPRNTSVSLRMVTAVQQCDFDRVRALLSNDFEAPVAHMVPEVAVALDALRALGAPALLSGSGSAVFALAETAGDLEALDEQLSLPPSYLRIRTRFRNSGVWRG